MAGEPGSAGLGCEMQLPKIVQAGNIVLRKPAEEVSPDAIGSKELRELISTMVATMRAAPGVGLAAPQIGVARRVIVVEDKEELMTRVSPEALAARERVPLPLRVIINPVLTVQGDRHVTFFEGCLSVGGYMGLVKRAHSVVVTGLDEAGAPVRLEATGWPARILQHEVDHLQGTLYIDRMLTRSFCAYEEGAAWVNKPTADILAALEV